MDSLHAASSRIQEKVAQKYISYGHFRDDTDVYLYENIYAEYFACLLFTNSIPHCSSSQSFFCDHVGEYILIGINSFGPSDAYMRQLTLIGSDNGLAPGRHQSITWINASILLIGPLGTHFSDILIEIHTFSFTKMHLNI